jgi:hypothetical protein
MFNCITALAWYIGFEYLIDAKTINNVTNKYNSKSHRFFLKTILKIYGLNSLLYLGILGFSSIYYK